MDRSLIDYTDAVVLEYLRSGDDSTKNRASLALGFFETILDPLIKEEKDQLDIFARHRAVLNGKFTFSIHNLSNLPR